MTVNERLKSLSSAFNMIDEGQYLVLSGIPNRLWYYDGHTSWLPFYHWLPNDIAIEYSRFSPRELGGFNTSFGVGSKDDSEKMAKFARWGRGVSYHELEIALGSNGNLKVHSYLQEFMGDDKRAFSTLLSRFAPDYISPAFFEPSLSLAIGN